MSRAIRWNERPTSRLYQVFNGKHVASGCWHERAKDLALAQMRKFKRGYVLIVDEYTAKLPHLGYGYRVVIGRIDLDSEGH